MKTRNLLYENEHNGSFFELKQVENGEEIIFDMGLFRGVWSKSSSGYVQKSGYTSAFGKNQMFFCTPYHDKIVQNVSGELYMFSFSHEFLRSPMLNSGFAHIYPLFLSIDFDNSVVLSEELSRDFDYLSERLARELSNPALHQEEMIGVIFSQILIHYQRLLTEKKGVVAEFQNGKGDGIIEMFYLLVEDHYKTKHQVKDYASLLGVSATMLSNAFRNFPISPLKLIHQRILLEAKRLLTYSNLSIKQVCFELGFPETSHFYHFFKNQMDMTPKEFVLATRIKDKARP